MYDFFVVAGLVLHAFPPIPGVEIGDDVAREINNTINLKYRESLRESKKPQKHLKQTTSDNNTSQQFPDGLVFFFSAN